MKQFMIMIDGMADRPCESLGGRTPLGAAHAPHIGRMRPLGHLHTTPRGMDTDSCNCILTILGLPPEHIPRGRVFLEALAAGVPAGPDDLLLRINFVAVENGRLINNGANYAGPLPELAGYEITPLSGYRAILRLRGCAAMGDMLRCFSPHEHIGRAFADIQPTGCALADTLRAAAETMLGRTGGISFVPWSPSVRTDLPAFSGLRGMRGAVVSGTPVVRGIALAMGMEAPLLPGATGDTDTDLYEKLEAALGFIDTHDFILLHINGADEAAHRRDAAAKTDFIAQVDREVVGPVLAAVTDRPVVVLSDHATLSATGGHDPMPVAAWGACTGGEVPAIGVLLPATTQPQPID